MTGSHRACLLLNSYSLQHKHEKKKVISKGFKVISNSGFLGLAARRSI